MKRLLESLDLLREKLKLRIKEDKNISFSEYMEIILFDKDYGLYEKEPVLGKEGHFITSPLVSKHFSHCIAKNFIKVSNDEKINYILEFGAGNAELARDLILYLKKKKTSRNLRTGEQNTPESIK